MSFYGICLKPYKMGIKGFSQFLRYIDCHWTTSPLSKFKGKRMAVDATMYLYHMKLSTREPARVFLEFLMKLWSLDITPIFVLDGQYTVEKMDEQMTRAKRRESVREVIGLLTAQLEDYKSKKIIGSELGKLSQSNCRFISKLDNTRLNIYAIQSHISKLYREVQPIPKNVKEMFWTVCEAFNIQIITADSDGEMLCATLNKTGLVDLVYSHDSDVFPAGALTVIKRIDGLTAQHLTQQEILTKSQLSFTSFRDFCILCGTDFNKKIMGLGPITAYNLLKKYENLEAVEQHVSYNLESINYSRVREIYQTAHQVEISGGGALDKTRVFKDVIIRYRLYTLWVDIKNLLGLRLNT
nr:MAG: DNA repair protein RAD2 [Enneapterygius tutuilae iridovirus]